MIFMGHGVLFAGWSNQNPVTVVGSRFSRGLRSFTARMFGRGGVGSFWL